MPLIAPQNHVSEVCIRDAWHARCSRQVTFNDEGVATLGIGIMFAFVMFVVLLVGAAGLRIQGPSRVRHNARLASVVLSEAEAKAGAASPENGGSPDVPLALDPPDVPTFALLYEYQSKDAYDALQTSSDIISKHSALVRKGIAETRLNQVLALCFYRKRTRAHLHRFLCLCPLDDYHHCHHGN